MAAGLVIGAGCVGAHYVPTHADAAYFPPKSADCAIEVFTAALPQRDFIEIGIVEGEGSHWKSDLRDVLPKLKEEACRAGGDALVLQSSETHPEGKDGHPVLKATATVIRWTT